MTLFFASPSAAPSSRIYSVDVLRGFMALAVAVYHLSLKTALFEAGTWGNNAIAVCGLYGVQGFFIVSGFCFFHLYGKSTFDGAGIKQFHIKRFFRIAPLYYLALAANLMLRQAKKPDDLAQKVFENLTFTFGLVQPARGQVAGGWSIGVEYVFYMVLPLLVFATRKKAYLYLGAVALMALAIPWTFFKVPTAPHFAGEKFCAYTHVANHFFLFFLGGIVAHVRSLTNRRLRTSVFLAIIALTAMAAESSANRFFDHFDIVTGFERARYVGFSLAVVALCAFYDIPETKPASAFIFLGDISYSVYLVHPFALTAILALTPDFSPLNRFWIGLAATIALASATYRWIEKPAMNLGRILASKVRNAESRSLSPAVQTDET